MFSTINETTCSQINITTAIAEADRQTAEKFALQQGTKEKAKQVYLNTLAVLVVRRYLEILDFPTELEHSYSWNAVDRAFLNVADLYLPELGFLECRPVRQGAKDCYVPPEVWSDRIAYVVVEIDRTCQNGVLRGFLPTVDREIIELEELQNIEEAIGYLHAYKPTLKLIKWLQHHFEKGWESPEGLLTLRSLAFRNHRAKSIENSSVEGLRKQLERLYGKLHKHPQFQPHSFQQQPLEALIELVQTIDSEEIRWQAAEILWSIDPENPFAGVRRVRDLGVYLEGNAIALMVGILPKGKEQLSILVRLYPLGDNKYYLPEGLSLNGWDNRDNSFIDVKSRGEDDYIQCKFIADVGESFCLKVSLGEASAIEDFCV
jgi:Protein of unknown function (DUF1822)